MASNAESQNPSPTNPPHLSQSVQPKTLSTLVTTAPTPLDFIKQSAATIIPPPNVTIPPMQDPTPKSALNFHPTAVIPPAPTNTAPDLREPVSTSKQPAEAIVSKEPVPSFEFEAKEEAPISAPENPDADIDEEVANPAGENFKKLRNAAKTARQKVRDLEVTLAEKEERLRRYDTGEVVPEVLQQKDQRIAKLEPFEKLFNLKNSEEYQSTFVTPVKDSKERMKKLFSDYGIGEEYLDQAVDAAINIDSPVQLNRFLADNDIDAIGAEEIKALATKSKQLLSKAKEAEQSPSQVLETLQAEAAAAKQQKDLERKAVMSANAKSAWSKSVMDIRKDGKLLALIPKVNDPEFNERVVNPILMNASQEYGKVVSLLAEQGLNNLPPELASYLANMSLKAHAVAVEHLLHQEAAQNLAELQQNTKHVNRLLRPSIGGGTARGADNGAGKPATKPVADAALDLIQGVLSRNGISA